MQHHDITVVITTFRSDTKIISCLASINSKYKVLIVENSNNTDFKNKIEKRFDVPFPQNAEEQLWGAIDAVFQSWNGKRAIDYRNIEKIPHSCEYILDYINDKEKIYRLLDDKKIIGKETKDGNITKTNLMEYLEYMDYDEEAIKDRCKSFSRYSSTCL